VLEGLKRKRVFDPDVLLEAVGALRSGAVESEDLPIDLQKS